LMGAVEVVADKTTKALHPSVGSGHTAADRRAARSRLYYARRDGLHLSWRRRSLSGKTRSTESPPSSRTPFPPCCAR
jgi:hypothetical protein